MVRYFSRMYMLLPQNMYLMFINRAANCSGVSRLVWGSKTSRKREKPYSGLPKYSLEVAHLDGAKCMAFSSSVFLSNLISIKINACPNFSDF